MRSWRLSYAAACAVRCGGARSDHSPSMADDDAGTILKFGECGTPPLSACTGKPGIATVAWPVVPACTSEPAAWMATAADHAMVLASRPGRETNNALMHMKGPPDRPSRAQRLGSSGRFLRWQNTQGRRVEHRSQPLLTPVLRQKFFKGWASGCGRVSADRGRDRDPTAQHEADRVGAR